MTVEEAQKSIALVLQQLEQETQRIVEAVEIHSTNVTEFGDHGQQYLRSVVIELKPQVGLRWQT